MAFAEPGGRQCRKQRPGAVFRGPDRQRAIQYLYGPPSTMQLLPGGPSRRGVNEQLCSDLRKPLTPAAALGISRSSWGALAPDRNPTTKEGGTPEPLSHVTAAAPPRTGASAYSFIGEERRAVDSIGAKLSSNETACISISLYEKTPRVYTCKEKGGRVGSRSQTPNSFSLSLTGSCFLFCCS